MQPPPGYTKAAPRQVWKLVHSLCGLKQASREWNYEFTTQLQAYGFIQSAHDHCLFTKATGNNFLALAVYVDDILITGSCLSDITALKHIWTIYLLSKIW